MSSSTSHTRTKLANDQLTIMFEHYTDQPGYPDSGPASGRSSPTNSSLPCTPVDNFPHSPLDAAVASEDSWNLIPYDVPWGPEYYHYRAGTLPGPEGACIFLRSPTPLKNRRTQKACNKCRQRKAKCSGTRPACMRCLARGYICEYVEEEKGTFTYNASRARRQREHSASSSEPTEATDSMSDCDTSESILPKQEPGLSTPELSFSDTHSSSFDSTTPSIHFHSHYDDAQYPIMVGYEYEGTVDAFGESAAVGDYYDQASYTVTHGAQAHQLQNASQVYHEATDHHSAASSVHAPRPVRCTSSPSFLSPEERIGTFATSFDSQTPQHCDAMLINLATASEVAPQIMLPHVPPMAPTQASECNAVEYAQPQAMYYYPPAEPTMQFPYLQYQYTVPTYTPGSGVQEAIAPAMLYAMPMPMLPVGMMA
ncbi:hypothetical protein BD310DRAFT_569004 [Dichomitus squalens]|uniref:Zn(2)-C6 fungal-type domain-containing protein n=1 Tax=Dichomitus squalens TaxID=114155 RepID=A0A4Q9PRT9_9APHY|nr:hypothetical protein BD310DRAFT_569004 [Dichomitus squalens]